MACNCPTQKVVTEYKSNAYSWNTTSLKTMQSNSVYNPELLEGEEIISGQALFNKDGDITSVYESGLRLAGISHVFATGPAFPNMAEINSEAMFKAYFENGADASTLKVGTYYEFVAGNTNEIDSTTGSDTNSGHLFLLKEIIEDGCGVAGAFVSCC